MSIDTVPNFMDRQVARLEAALDSINANEKPNDTEAQDISRLAGSIAEHDQSTSAHDDLLCRAIAMLGDRPIHNAATLSFSVANSIPGYHADRAERVAKFTAIWDDAAFTKPRPGFDRFDTADESFSEARHPELKFAAATRAVQFAPLQTERTTTYLNVVAALARIKTWAAENRHSDLVEQVQEKLGQMSPLRTFNKAGVPGARGSVTPDDRARDAFDEKFDAYKTADVGFHERAVLARAVLEEAAKGTGRVLGNTTVKSGVLDIQEFARTYGLKDLAVEAQRVLDSITMPDYTGVPAHYDGEDRDDHTDLGPRL